MHPKENDYINLVRQKMMLPKLPFPKRKLAISPDQMTAIKALYEPLLPSVTSMPVQLEPLFFEYHI